MTRTATTVPPPPPPPLVVTTVVSRSTRGGVSSTMRSLSGSVMARLSELFRFPNAGGEAGVPAGLDEAPGRLLESGQKKGAENDRSDGLVGGRRRVAAGPGAGADDLLDRLGCVEAGGEGGAIFHLPPAADVAIE